MTLKISPINTRAICTRRYVLELHGDWVTARDRLTGAHATFALRGAGVRMCRAVPHSDGAGRLWASRATLARLRAAVRYAVATGHIRG